MKIVILKPKIGILHICFINRYDKIKFTFKPFLFIINQLIPHVYSKFMMVYRGSQFESIKSLKSYVLSHNKKLTFEKLNITPMESNLLTELFLPLALGIIMLGMGLSLTMEDFKRILVYPKAVFIGLFSQLVILPAIGFLLMYHWDLKPEFAVGIILLAACPGGPTSNLFTFLGKGDAALSITLTAISSFITIFTIPFLVNLGLDMFMGEEQDVRLPVLQTIIQIMVITVIPVSIGMVIKSKNNTFAKKMERPVKIASALFITLIIAGAILKDRANVIPAFKEAGIPALTLNIITLLLGFFVARLLGLKFRQASTVSIESGIQNGTLAIAIAASATLLNNPQIAIPPAVYSIIMFFTGAIAVSYFSKKNSIE
jgi:bile acid:Na+ symporter, BASS family